MKVTIEKLDNFGRGITHINNKICFVDNALPGEVVEIEITKEKSKFIEAKTISIINPSKDRIEVDCPYYNVCGGCSLRHLKYDKENEFKENKIQELLKHIGKLDIKINNIITGPENNYRNKVTFHKSKNMIGYYQKGTRNIISIDNCLLLDNVINDNIKNINSDSHEIIIRSSNDGNSLLINDIDSIITNIGDKKYYLSKDSFFQVNKYLTKELYDLVRKAVDKPYKTCLDLYCGTGSIGIYISDLVDNVVGIDNNKSNIEDAENNIKLNSINNIKFICDNVEDKIDSFNNIDLIIVDPPRSGLDNKTKKYLLDINPERIIYISCDPASLGRDLKELKTNYNILEVTPVNMFPRTYHCESIAVLERK